MSSVNDTFKAIKLYEAKAKTVVLLAGIHEHEMGFATYHHPNIILRLRRCDLIDGYMVKDLTGEHLDVNKDYDPEWVQKNLHVNLLFSKNSIVGSNDSYPAGYILFYETDPNFRITSPLSQEDWDFLITLREVSLYYGQDGPEQQLTTMILLKPETSGWLAPMEDQ